MSHGVVPEILAEPMTMHYAAVNKDGRWHELGDRILPGKEPVGIFREEPQAADAQECDLTGAIWLWSHIDYGSD